jgi:hypothetical protein
MTGLRKIRHEKFNATGLRETSPIDTLWTVNKEQSSGSTPSMNSGEVEPGGFFLPK